jgi:cell division septation protein DedD
MYCTKSGIEIKDNIEIVMLILIVVLAAVSVLSCYALKEPQKANQAIPLIKPTPPPSVNKATASLQTVQLPTQRQETKTTLQEKKNLAAEPVVPAVEKTNTGQLPSQQKTAEPFQENTKKVSKTEKTINRSLYYIKVGSFQVKENAYTIWKKLKENGYEPSLEIVTMSDNSIWHRVTAGQFKTWEEAARCAKKLEDKEKLKTMIVKMSSTLQYEE